jgi:hypothetical protein
VSFLGSALGGAEQGCVCADPLREQAVTRFCQRRFALSFPSFGTRLRWPLARSPSPLPRCPASADWSRVTLPARMSAPIGHCASRSASDNLPSPASSLHSRSGKASHPATYSRRATTIHGIAGYYCRITDLMPCRRLEIESLVLLGGSMYIPSGGRL